MRCPNCDNEQAEVLLINCALPLGEERDRVRFCRSCKPESEHELAGYAPRMLVRMNLPEEVLRAALVARRFVPDRRASYAIAERTFDLTAGTPANERIN